MKKPVILLLVGGLCGGGIVWMYQRNSSEVEAIHQETITMAQASSGASRPSFDRGSGDPKNELGSELNATNAINKLLERKHRYPSVATIAGLSSKDEAQLVVNYLAQEQLSNRISITWGLAAVGNHSAFAALKDTLLAQYEGRELVVREFEVMRDSLEALGFIAGRSDEAYAFLLAASNEEFWATNRTWSFAPFKTERDASRSLARIALQATGASLRPEVSERITQLRLENGEYSRAMCGSIATAAYYLDYGQKYGSVELLSTHLMGGDGFQKFTEWRATETGESWWNWYQAMERQR